MSSLDFVYRFEPGSSATTLLLLHGTGGDERDLLPLGRMLASDAALLSPRGKVLENGMPRFFRRLAEGVFDVPDLIARTHELAQFVRDATAHHSLDAARVIAAGFSNGANIAASLLLLHPGLLTGAALFRPMVPFEPERLPDLSGTRVLVAGGTEDPIVPRRETERLAELLRVAKADVTTEWQRGGHGLMQEDVTSAHRWLASFGDRPAAAPTRRSETQP